MIFDLHTEVLLAAGYALFLVGVAATLEFVARNSHHRSERYRKAGFIYKPTNDVWECPTGHDLKREKTDFERKIAHYRAAAHKCNSCHLKRHCTDSEGGRLLEHRLDGWLQSELSRFHRGISLALFLLAFVVLLTEMFRHHEKYESVALLALLIPIGFAGSRHLVSFVERASEANSSLNNRV
jgi:hypothetical protein